MYTYMNAADITASGHLTEQHVLTEDHDKLCVSKPDNDFEIAHSHSALVYLSHLHS